MFRCQYCKTTIFLDWTKKEWTAIQDTTCYFGGPHQPHQLAEFYRFKDGHEELFTTENLILIRNGEMRLRTPTGDVLHYSDQILKAGITIDNELSELYETESILVINNPWFEIIVKSNPHGDAQVYDTLDEGLRVLFETQDSLDTYQQLTD